MKTSPNRLGPLISRHALRPLTWRGMLALVLLGAAAVGGPLAYGLDRYTYGYAKYGPVAAIFWSRPWYLLALAALLVLLILAFVRVRQSHRFVALHRHGLFCSFARQKVLRWENIAGVAVEIQSRQFLGRSLGARYRARLYPVTGKPIHLPHSLKDLPDLLTQIKAHLYPRLIPQLKQAFQAGQWLYFGPVSIQAAAFRLADRGDPGKAQTTAWDGIKSISIHLGRLVVEFNDGSRRRLPVAAIPNLEIMLQIIQTGVST